MSQLISNMWLSFLLILTFLYILYKYMTRHFSYWKDRNVFHLKPIPFVGNMWPVLSFRRCMGEFLKDLYDSTDQDYIGCFLLDKPALILRSPKLIKNIILHDFNYFSDRIATAESDVIMSNSVFFKKGPMWKTLRERLSPVFSSGKLKSMSKLIITEADSMANYIDKFVNIPNIDSKEICAKYSTNVIAVSAFGIKAHCFDSETAEFRNISRNMFKFSLSNTVRQAGCFLFPNVIDIFKIRLFENWILERLQQIFTEVMSIRVDMEKRNDMIDILLQQKREKNMSDYALLAQAIQFFLAGFETISTTMSFFLYEMAIHPEIQERLRKEILKSISENGGISYEAVQDMKYLNMCLSETLRKYPVMSILDRTCTMDYKVPGSDYVIKKGQIIFVPLLGLHYDSKYFPDPEKFDPERFQNMSNFNNDGFSYIPFGAGPKNCIGARFGLLSLKIGLSTIMSKYELCPSSHTPSKMQFEPKHVFLQSAKGTALEFRPL
ncbi:cytochrome P450 6k1-like isoform X2 [Rhynchophorus ferrugineus]|uniref:Cytochrome P450 n=1 Tax=Rhynchophorus ferrugineus TaxID=354439 RepID=A0A834ITF7_RHYFE|nr:hypothetical protein GWI33_010124 [Rhynchophorus ferrugineus]